MIEALASPYRRGDLFLGRVRLFTNGGLLRSVGIATEKHMVTIAEPGAGKSTAAAIPNLCLHEGSLLCVDPKGELATITAARRGQGGRGVKGLGQTVRILDPYHVVKGLSRASYNPFDELAAVAVQSTERPISYAGRIAEALIKPCGNAENDYFDSAARTFIRGLVLHVFTGPAEHRNLRHLRRLVMEGDVELHRQKLAAAEITDKGRNAETPFDVLVSAMIETPPGPYRDVIAGAAASVKMMGDRQRGCVLTTAQEQTSFLDLPEILNTTDRSDFLLEEFKTQKLSVYLCLPINELKGNAGRWLRLFVLLFIDMMMRKQEAPKLPVLLLIDEFPNLGKLDGIEIVAPVMRSYGVRLWVIGQDLGQFKATYPDTWEGFIGCAQAVQFLSVKHPETVAYLVKLLGEKLIRERTPDGRVIARPVPLLDEEQVSRFLEASGKNQIIWRGDQRPLRLKAAPYFSYLPFWMYSPDPRFREAKIKAFFRSRAAGKPARRMASGSSSAWSSALRSAGLWLLVMALLLSMGCQRKTNAPVQSDAEDYALLRAIRTGDLKSVEALAGDDMLADKRSEVNNAMRFAIGRDDVKAAEIILPCTFGGFLPFQRYAFEHRSMAVYFMIKARTGRVPNPR